MFFIYFFWGEFLETVYIHGFFGWKEYELLFWGWVCGKPILFAVSHEKRMFFLVHNPSNMIEFKHYFLVLTLNLFSERYKLVELNNGFQLLLAESNMFFFFFSWFSLICICLCFLWRHSFFLWVKFCLEFPLFFSSGVADYCLVFVNAFYGVVWSSP